MVIQSVSIAAGAVVMYGKGMVEVRSCPDYQNFECIMCVYIFSRIKIDITILVTFIINIIIIDFRKHIFKFYQTNLITVFNYNVFKFIYLKQCRYIVIF